MKTAVNPPYWHGWAKHSGVAFDLDAFLDDAAAAGFDGVELGALDGVAPEELRRRVEARGLEIAAIGANVTYNPWKPNTEQCRTAFRYAHDAGCTTIVCCGGFIPNGRRNTWAFDYDMFAGNLGRALAAAERLGLILAFHNHRGCVVETVREARELVKRLPELKLTLDIAHAEACGEDALSFVTTFRRRIVYTHVKDYHWGRDSFVELGKGDGALDPAACIAALAGIGYDGWLTVELDQKWGGRRTRKTPRAHALASRRYLRRCGH